MIYGFQSANPSTKFCDNLYRIQSLAANDALFQQSVYMARDQRSAEDLRELVQHHGEDVTVFKGELVDLE